MQFQRYITAHDAGISNGITVLDDDYVVWSMGALRGYNEVAHGDLEVSETLTIDEVAVEAKSAFTLLREAADSMSRSQYASICGVFVSTMESLATAFLP